MSDNTLLDSAPLNAVDPLSPICRRFVLHWGEMGTKWGVNRTVAQIHALLFLAGRPMHAEEIGEILSVARSNVSTSVRELINLNLVKVVHQLGERRDHFETTTDVWMLFRTVVTERKAREFDPTIEVLASLVNDQSFAREDLDRQKRIAQTLEIMQVLSSWAEEMMKLEPATLMKILKLGSRIQKLVRDSAKK